MLTAGKWVTSTGENLADSLLLRWSRGVAVPAAFPCAEFCGVCGGGGGAGEGCFVFLFCRAGETELGSQYFLSPSSNRSREVTGPIAFREEFEKGRTTM